VIVVDTSTGDDGKTRIRSYSKIDASTLRAVASEKEEVYVKASKGYEIRRRKVIKVGSLVLSSTPMPSPSSEEVTSLYLDTINELGGVSALLSMQSKKDAAALQELLQRMSIARRSSSDDDWPSCFASLDAIRNGIGTEDDERFVLDVIEPWLGAAESLKGLDLLSILNSELSPAQQNHLENFFPTKITAPDGSAIPISYYSEAGPVAIAKLQQFFGQQESPAVGPPGKTTPVTLSLLSPSGKPLAQTIDLPFFWRETYPVVRAEMRGRYPKHPWPEDPITAVATRLTKKQEMKLSGEGTIDKRKERSKQRKNR
jgi:ATP-dependent helicase HrpB